jgi:fructose PTS system EIIBC or EIIC component
MAKTLVAVTACPTGIAHTYMAAEALKKAAELMGYELKVETQGSEGTKNPLSEADIAAAEAVVIAADTHVDMAPFKGKPVYESTTSEAIRDPKKLLEAALAAVPAEAEAAAQEAPAPAAGGKRLIGVTACPTGIAHTFMAAESLRKTAEAMGHQMRVETQGSVGAQDTLTDEEIAAADAVIIGADTHVDLSRFAGKTVIEASVTEALKQPSALIEKALSEQAQAPTGKGGEAYLQQVKQAKAERSAQRSGPYKHLLTGVSYMLPVVVAGGLLIALSFVFGIHAFETKGTLAAALMDIGGGTAFKLMVPVLSGFIAFSIADRPGLAPGLVGGMLATNLGAGFIGGIISGFLAGYIALWLRDNIRLPQNLEGLKPMLIIPLLSTLAVGLLMVYVIGGPVRAILDALTAFLNGMGTTNAILLGVLLGGMMAVDMGGPVNKAAYTFAVGLLGSQVYTPMAAVMAAGMTPPLGLALATLVARNRFTAAEHDAGKAAIVLGLSFITEGAIPFAAKDPLRVIPSCIVGSAFTGALSMLFHCQLRAPHGGVFVLAIPHAVSHLLLYGVAIVAGTIVTAAAVILVKKPIVETAPVVG